VSDSYRKKPWYKPDKAWKRIERGIERARLNHAVRMGHDLPIIKRHDIWDYS